ncbi:hypothetical protein AB0H00_29630 [Nocardia sp. NPDC023852]
MTRRQLLPLSLVTTATALVPTGGGHHICEQRVPGTDKYYA